MYVGGGSNIVIGLYVLTMWSSMYSPISMVSVVMILPYSDTEHTGHVVSVVCYVQW